MMTNEDIEQAKKEIGTTTSLWFYTKDINNTYKELQEKGVNITEPKRSKHYRTQTTRLGWNNVTD
jgi:uncharacterized glyoxalase superfamily protein PhnB